MDQGTHKKLRIIHEYELDKFDCTSIYSVFIINIISYAAFRVFHSLTICHVYIVPTLISFMY